METIEFWGVYALTSDECLVNLIVVLLKLGDGKWSGVGLVLLNFLLQN